MLQCMVIDGMWFNPLLALKVKCQDVEDNIYFEGEYVVDEKFRYFRSCSLCLSLWHLGS